MRVSKFAIMILSVFMVGCGSSTLPIHTTDIAISTEMTGQAQLPVYDSTGGIYYGSDGVEIPTLPEYDTNDTISTLNVPYPCPLPYDQTGAFVRLQNDTSDKTYGKAAYQRGTFSIPALSDIKLNPYVNGVSQNKVYPGVYMYLGGAGGKGNGQGIDAGMTYAAGTVPGTGQQTPPYTGTWQPYIQVAGVGPINMTALSELNSRKSGFSYSASPGENVTMESYPTNKGTYIVVYKNPSGFNAYDKNNKNILVSGKSSRTEIAFEIPISGWSQTPQVETGAGNGQPLKFASSIAYNMPIEVYDILAKEFKDKYPSLYSSTSMPPKDYRYYLQQKTLSAEAKTALAYMAIRQKDERVKWLVGRNDSISNFKWDEAIIGVITGYDTKGRAIHSPDYPLSKWVNTASNVYDCPTNSATINIQGDQFTVSIKMPGEKPKLNANSPSGAKAKVGATLLDRIIITLLYPTAQPIGTNWNISPLTPNTPQVQITPQAIPASDLPTLATTSGSVTTSQAASVDFSYLCQTPGPHSFNYTVSDPAGYAQPATFTISVTCIGPKMTAPTPNPLSISANVGSTATGSFSFGNCPGGTANDCAPLNFTVSGSTGLSVGSSASPLAVGGTATVNVGYPCTIAGTFPATATVGSDDPAMPSSAVTVNVTCIGIARLTGPTPNPLELNIANGGTTTGDFTLTNSGSAPLTYSLSGAQADGYGPLSFTDFSGTILPGTSHSITAKLTCGYGFTTTSKEIIVNTNDPDHAQVKEVINLICRPPTFTYSNSVSYKDKVNTRSRLTDFTFINTGDSSVSFNLTNSSGAYVIGSRLEAGTSRTFDLQFGCDQYIKDDAFTLNLTVAADFIGVLKQTTIDGRITCTPGPTFIAGTADITPGTFGGNPIIWCVNSVLGGPSDIHGLPVGSTDPNCTIELARGYVMGWLGYYNIDVYHGYTVLPWSGTSISAYEGIVR